MFTFLLIVQTLIAAALVAVILMQRSEGGGLGVGGSSSGLLTARAAADFLTRATTVLATLFVILSIALAGLAAVERAPAEFDTSLARDRAPAAPVAPVPGSVPLADPLAGAAGAVGSTAVPSTAAGDVPLAQPARSSPRPAARAPAAPAQRPADENVSAVVPGQTPPASATPPAGNNAAPEGE